jgi:hypothetical protein
VWQCANVTKGRTDRVWNPAKALNRRVVRAHIVCAQQHFAVCERLCTSSPTRGCTTLLDRPRGWLCRTEAGGRGSQTRPFWPNSGGNVGLWRALAGQVVCVGGWVCVCIKFMHARCRWEGWALLTADDNLH